MFYFIFFFSEKDSESILVVHLVFFNVCKTHLRAGCIQTFTGAGGESSDCYFFPERKLMKTTFINFNEAIKQNLFDLFFQEPKSKNNSC